MKFSINPELFNLKFFLYGFILFIGFYTFKGCSNDETKPLLNESTFLSDNYKFGYNFNNYNVVYDTIQKGDSFGEILEKISSYTQKSITLLKLLKRFLTFVS